MKNVPAEALLSVNALPTYSSKTDEAGNTLLEGTAFCPTLSTPQDAEAPRITYLAAPYESGAQGAVWVPEFGAEVQKYLKK